MTRKDYILVASVLADLDGYELGLSIGAHKEIAEAFADAFKKENPAFKREGFLKAADVTL